MESKVPFRVKMESLQKTTNGIFSRKFYYGSPGTAIGFSRFSANSSTLQGTCMNNASAFPQGSKPSENIFQLQIFSSITSFSSILLIKTESKFTLSDSHLLD
jgi:hypothetical protein